MLTWEDSYAIARELRRRYKHVNLQDVSLEMIYTWTLALEDFADDAALANDELLKAIFQEWFEEELSA